MNEFPDSEGEQLNDASLDAFLAEQEQADSKAAEDEEAVRQTIERIVETLDQAGAVRLWDPDSRVRDENEIKAREGLIEADLYFIPKTMSPAVRARLRLAEEVTMVKILGMNMMALEVASPDKRQALDVSSKQTLARLMAFGFDEGWQSAARELLGVDLDLSKEVDLQIYAEQSIADATAQQLPKIQAVGSIINEGIPEDDEDILRRHSLVMRLGQMILAAERGEQQRANITGQLYELAGEGQITEGQRDALLRLLSEGHSE